MDVFNRFKRSEVMSRIRSYNTLPEMVVRRLLRGLSFRLHLKDLIGKPDIVFPRRKKLIFVHGCFWHRHRNCRYAQKPKSNVRFWKEQFTRNVVRDKNNKKILRSRGWKIVVIWECQTKNVSKLSDILARFLKK